MGKKESIRIIENFVERLSKDFSVHRIIFFGSRVNGRARRDSDIDIIVVSDNFEGMNFFKRVTKMYDYWDELVPVDFLCYTITEFERLKKRISIVKEALENGIVVR